MVRLRRWLLAAALLLAAGLAGVLGFANYRAHHLLTALPRLLGADVRSETNGFTYSQSVKGRTLFTIHASKAIQRQNGKTTLHDVDITLNGQPGSKRTDRIRGAEFEYDQPNGIIRAAGEVHLDLASLADGVPGAAAGSAERRMQVTTSGLVFLEKLGVAATEQPIFFRYGDLSGEARGADYDADSGTLRLRHDVHLRNEADGQRSTLNASAAELDRVLRRATLREASLTSPTQNLTAGTMFLSLRPGGSVETIRAEDRVVLRDVEGARAEAPQMVAEVSEANRLRQVQLSGGVRYTAAGQSATAAETTLSLDGAGQPRHAILLHGVTLQQDDSQTHEHRVLTADRIDTDLTAGTDRKVFPKSVVATGMARLVTTAPAPPGARLGSRRVLEAHTLSAMLSGRSGRWSVEEVKGDGATRLEELDGHGGERSSTADSLLVLFQPGKQGDAADAVRSAVQQGNVVLSARQPATPATRTAAAKPASESRATAQLATYNGSSESLILSGSPELRGTGLQMTAARIVMLRSNGNVTAEGVVKATYDATAAKGATTPSTHVFAERAELTEANNHLRFSAPGGLVRLWNSSSQLQAPVIELDRSSGRLLAHDLGTETGTGPRTGTQPKPGAGSKPGVWAETGAVVALATATVHAVLPSTGSAVSGGKGKTANAPVRLTSRTLIWTQGNSTSAGEAVFGGGVRLEQAGATVVADSATAFLRGVSSADAPAKPSPTLLLGGNVEKVIANGDVRLTEPGRTGRGTQLVYTAADGRFELTGTVDQRPEIRDSVRGSITGTSLIFHAGDDSVEVSGSPGTRVHSETRVKGSGRPN